MHFDTAHHAMRAIKIAKLGSVCIAVPDHASGQGGWRIEQQDSKPLTTSQREKLEAVGEAMLLPQKVVAQRRTAAPSVKAASEPAPVAKRVVGKRTGGAAAICREVFAEHNTDKMAFVAACAERGVFAGTAKARWTDLVRAAQNNA